MYSIKIKRKDDAQTIAGILFKNGYDVKIKDIMNKSYEMLVDYYLIIY